MSYKGKLETYRGFKIHQQGMVSSTGRVVGHLFYTNDSPSFYKLATLKRWIDNQLGVDNRRKQHNPRFHILDTETGHIVNPGWQAARAFRVRKVGSKRVVDIVVNRGQQNPRNLYSEWVVIHEPRGTSRPANQDRYFSTLKAARAYVSKKGGARKGFYIKKF